MRKPTNDSVMLVQGEGHRSNTTEAYAFRECRGCPYKMGERFTSCKNGRHHNTTVHITAIDDYNREVRTVEEFLPNFVAYGTKCYLTEKEILFMGAFK